MSPILLSFADGSVYFIGLVLVVAGLALLSCVRRFWLRSILTVLVLCGVILVVISATPLPLWVYITWIAFVAVGLVVAAHIDASPKAKSICVVLIGILSLVLFCVELPYHYRPRVTVSKNTTIYVLGDSISAGMGNVRATWPEVFSQSIALPVVNLARAGARVEGAIEQARMVTGSNALVIVEIGGNDLLGNGVAEDFKRSLDALVGALCEEGHDVLLFELPLFPFKNEYGAAQREIARKYTVTMLPKRVFAEVLAVPGATSDGLHLSQVGHDAMAQTITDVIQER